MRILQVLPELNVGGVETGTLDLAKYLVNHGHQSIVVSNGGVLVDELVKTGSRHYQLPVHRKSLWSILCCAKKLEKIITDEKIDIVHARSRVPAWAAFFACRRTKTAFMTTCHGYYSNHLLSRVMGWGKLVIVISEVIGHHMMNNFKVPPENIRLIHRSVDLEKFKFDPSAKKPSQIVISNIGRLTPIKGQDFFLKAMAKVVRLKPFVKIWLIGDAPESKLDYKENLLSLVKRLGISNNVEFLGNRRDVPQLLAQTSVVVLSTVTREAFGRAVIEAQAAGVAVVANSVGGVVEIIEHGKTGLLVTPKDTDEMANAVLKVLDDNKLARSMTEAARENVENHFTLDHMAQATLKVYEEVLTDQKILVIKLSSIGDAILITGTLKALRQKYPNAKIHCLIGKEASVVLKRCPYIDGMIIYDFKGQQKGLWGLWRLAQELQKYRFDKVIDLQNNRKSHLISFLSLPQKSYGFDNGKWGKLLSYRVVNDVRPTPPVEHQFRILDALGVRFDPKIRLELWPSSQEREYVQELLESHWMTDHQDFVGINVSASHKWPTKNWPEEYIAKLCDLLAAENIRCVLTGHSTDRALARRIVKLSKGKPADFVGKTTLLQLAALTSRCRVYITPDSAPLHVAAAMKTPVIAFFGPTDSLRHMPPSEDAVVLQKSMPCAPCYSSTCRINTHACMKEITPEEVFRKVMDLIKIKNRADSLN